MRSQAEPPGRGQQHRGEQYPAEDLRAEENVAVADEDHNRGDPHASHARQNGRDTLCGRRPRVDQQDAERGRERRRHLESQVSV